MIAFAITALGLGIYLVDHYNISTHYASPVATATQTVKLCHNECRYVSKEVALLLRLGEGLIVAAGLSVVVLSMWTRRNKG